jgi:hypothetical protein
MARCSNVARQPTKSYHVTRSTRVVIQCYQTPEGCDNPALPDYNIKTLLQRQHFFQLIENKKGHRSDL